ncbi:hypothetical protein [Microbacterium sp. W4I20]|uniref:hypothetical protein n=1 Tax=Microbacterium sp. W4I20 TaxID=3042262 RepID=UPI00277FA9FF|nr:hypothetical protein [Microbacterium sp. W4I20]MDQ0727474.1 hypothetical protein [Microbacterium sp. W4I20]
MAILGVNGTTSCLWLAVVSDVGDVLDAPHNFALASNTPLDEQIALAVDDATRLFDRFSVDAVVILDAETGRRNAPSYSQLVPRISLEAAMMYAAHKHGITAARIPRARVRSVMDLAKNGKLSDLAATVLDAHAPHWTGKRDLAALVAVAELKSSG